MGVVAESRTDQRSELIVGDGTRDLLMTVLGEFVLPNGGAAWTRTLLALTNELDMTDKAARQALARLEQRGHLHRTRHGRQTRWHLSPATADLLTTGAEQIYGFATGGRTWNGQWLVVLASVPERDRAARYRMAVELRWAGFGTLGHGTWICPWLDREQSATATLSRLGIDATVFRAEIGDLGSGSDLVERAWDIETLRNAYSDFVSWAGGIDPTATGAQPAHDLVALVHRWRRFPFSDPDLPSELFDATWPAAGAAKRFAELRRALTPAAQQWWTDIDDPDNE